MIGTNCEACSSSEYPRASALSMPNNESASTVAAWNTPMKPGLEGRLTPRPMKAMTQRAAAMGRSRRAAWKHVHTDPTMTTQMATDHIAVGTRRLGRRMLWSPSLMVS